MQVAFNGEVKQLFEKFPRLNSFSWTQYTPYFNDGDTCVFRVHTDDPDINGIEGYEISKAWGKYTDSNPELIPLKEAVEEFLASVPQESFLDLFGDHAQVTVTRKGVTTDEYSHD